MKEKKTTTKDVAVKENKENSLIISPRITEKASLMSSNNAYTFVVSKNATKITLKDEIKKKYKVTPIAVNITNIPRKKVFVRGKFGYLSGFKKATVFLKKGDTINLS
jgi:large subunit ribosomal protein L23